MKYLLRSGINIFLLIILILNILSLGLVFEDQFGSEDNNSIKDPLIDIKLDKSNLNTNSPLINKLRSKMTNNLIDQVDQVDFSLDKQNSLDTVPKIQPGSDKPQAIQSTDLWTESEYYFRKKITIDSTKVSGLTSLPNFPIYIELYDSDLKDKAQLDGDDILFVDLLTGTRLDHEIEVYNQGYNASHAYLSSWVRIPSLSPSVDTELYMYFGNSSVSSQANPAGVWNSDYEFVLHFNDDPSSSDILDSTANTFNFDVSGGMSSSDLVDGQTGKALSLDGSNDFIYLPLTENFNGPSNGFSFEFWIMFPDGGPLNGAKRTLSRPATNDREPRINFDGFIDFEVETNIDKNNVESTSQSAFAGNTWFQFFLIWDNTGSGSLKIYIDGSFENQITGGGLDGTLVPWNTWAIGAEDSNIVGGDSKNNIQAVISEFRLLNSVLSTDWITTSFANQNSSFNFYSIAELQKNDLISPVINNFGVNDEGNGFPQFWANVTDEASQIANVTLRLNGSLYDMNINGSGYWIYRPSTPLIFNANYDYLISNASDTEGNFLTSASSVNNILLDLDTTFPTILDRVFDEEIGSYGIFRVNASDSWGIIDTVIVNVTFCDCQGPSSAIMQYDFASGEYVNDSLQMIAGGINYEIFINDTSNNIFITSTTPDNSLGIPPSVDNLSLGPSPNYSNETLILTYDFSDNDTGGVESGTEIRWFKNSTITSGLELQSEFNDLSSIPFSALTKEDQWYVTVRPKDGIKFGDLKTSSIVTIENTPPIINTWNLSPSNPFTTDDLIISYSYFDIDNDTQINASRVIRWYNNASGSFLLQSQFNDILLIPSGFTNSSRAWYYTLQVYDGENISILYTSNTVIIQNSQPNISGIPTFNVISPTNTTTNFNIVFTYIDADNDAESESMRLIYWFVNGFEEPAFYNQQIIYGSNTSEGDWWYYKIRVFDGLVYSANITSGIIVIGVASNNAPTASNLKFINVDNKTTNDLEADYSYSDPESNLESQTEIRWYKNSTTTSGFDLQAAFNDIRIISSAFTLKGDQWYFSVNVSDGLDYGALKNSSILIILNSIPVVSAADLSPQPITDTSNQLQASYIISDPDTQDNLTVIIKWYRNGTEILALENLILISSSNTSKYDVWKFGVTIFDGSILSSQKNSTTVSILNTRPEIQNVVLVGGVNTNSNISVYYDFIDADNDLNNTLIQWWTLSGSIPGASSNVLDSSLFDAGDTVYVILTPNDGEENGAIIFTLTLTNGFIVVGNSNPEIIGQPILVSSNSNSSLLLANATISIEYNATDADGISGISIYELSMDVESRVIGAEYSWYKNSSGNFELIVGLTNPVVPLEHLFKGDWWIGSVRPVDRFGSFGPWVNSSIIVIDNTAPAVTVVIWNLNQPTTEDDLSIVYSYFDTDSDPEILEQSIIKWYFDNGTEMLTVQNQTTISHLLFQKGDLINVSILPFDGESYGPMFNSSIKIVNAPPKAIYININPNNPFSGDELRVVWNYTDADGDPAATLPLIFWERNGESMPNLNNLSIIPASEINEGENWKVIIQVFDGEDYSVLSAGQSTTITIISANLQFNNAQYSFFLLSNEDLNISFSYSDSDMNEDFGLQSGKSFIYWYKNGIYQAQFDNFTVISASETSPGEIWNFKVIPYNGISLNAPLISENRIIESLPTFVDSRVVPLTDTEGHFLFWVNVSDSRNSIESVRLVIILNASQNSQTLPLTYNGTLWILLYQLTDYSLLTTNASVKIEASTQVTYFNIESTITNQINFEFTMNDVAPPRVLNVDIRYDNDITPTNITFIVEIEEFGSGIDQIFLYYRFESANESTDDNSLSLKYSISQNVNFDKIALEPINETYYSVTLDIKFTTDTIILFDFEVTDLAGNSNPSAFPEGLDANRPDAVFQFRVQGLSTDEVLGIVLLMAVILLAFSFVIIKKFRSTELVGLDKDLVLAKAQDLDVVKEVLPFLDLHTLGIMASFFDQRHGPIPIIVIPRILRDNYEILVEMSDMSFSSARFSGNFDTEIFSTFSFNPIPDQFISLISFGFALNRPEARGGAENITLNLLIHNHVSDLVTQFIDKFREKIHDIHVLMDKEPDKKKLITKKIEELRIEISKIIISYENLYGTTEVLESYEFLEDT